MPLSRNIILATATCALSLIAATAHAQQRVVTQPPPAVVQDRSKLPAPPPETWEQASRTRFPRGAEVETAAAPHTRRRCDIQSFDADRIVCKHAFGRTETFAREQVAVIYARPSQGSGRGWAVIPAMLAGGNVYWAVLLAGAGPLGIAAIVPVGCFALLWTEATVMVALDEGEGPREIYRRSAQQIAGGAPATNSTLSLAEVHP